MSEPPPFRDDAEISRLQNIAVIQQKQIKAEKRVAELESQTKVFVKGEAVLRKELTE